MCLRIRQMWILTTGSLSLTFMRWVSSSVRPRCRCTRSHSKPRHGEPQARQIYMGVPRRSVLVFQIQILRRNPVSRMEKIPQIWRCIDSGKPERRRMFEIRNGASDVRQLRISAAVQSGGNRPRRAVEAASHFRYAAQLYHKRRSRSRSAAHGRLHRAFRQHHSERNGVIQIDDNDAGGSTINASLRETHFQSGNKSHGETFCLVVNPVYCSILSGRCRFLA